MIINSDFVEVAQIGKSVGLKGALKLHLRCDFPEQFKKRAKFYTNSGKILVIKDINKDKNVVSFENYENIDLAKALVNLKIYSTKEESRKNCILQDGEYFWFDVIGCEVLEEEKKLGIVDGIDYIGNYYLLYIASDEKLVKDGLSDFFYIPYNDRYVSKIDLEKKVVYTIDSLEILKNS